jgi:tetratricopeptide (TPR) repeat protein
LHPFAALRPSILAVALPLTLEGTVVRGSDPGALDSIAARVDSLYFAESPDKSLALCVEVIAAGDGSAGLHWRAARAEIAMGMLSAPRSAERKERYDSALAHARRGLALSPTDIDARYWVAAAAGRRARRDDPVYSVKLGYEVYDIAASILAADSMHAGAHHALGMVHAEVLRAPRFIRFLAGSVLRIDVARRANWKDAELHLRRAAQLDSSMMLFAVDLADLYGRAGRTAERDAILIQLSRVEPRHPMDRAYRDACIRRWRRPLVPKDSARG